MLLVELCIWKMQGLFIEPHLLSLHCDLLIFSYLDFPYFRNNFKSLSDHVYKQMIAWLPLNLNTTTTATNNNTTMEKKNVCKWHLALAASNSTLLVGSAEKHFETTLAYTDWCYECTANTLVSLTATVSWELPQHACFCTGRTCKLYRQGQTRPCI